jgi:hypothetical protein
MSDTRRSLLRAAVAAAGAAALPAQSPPPSGRGSAAPAKPASEVQVPRIKFGGVEISRLICGCNPFYGFGHFNRTLDSVMQQYYTAERVCDVLHQCNRFGINAFNYYPGGRGLPDFERFRAEGGQMHLIAQGIGDPVAQVKALKPLAMYHHGGNTDRAYQTGQMETVREWCKKVRDLGVLAGVGSHKPEVLALVEEQNWDVDFYAGCVYNVSRTTEEWKKVFSGELVEMQGECYLQSDPPRMYKVLRAIRKPCFAYKILAAGRVANADQAFRTAFESIKPTDGIFVGLFPAARDEVRDNAERAHRILAGA